MRALWVANRGIRLAGMQEGVAAEDLLGLTSCLACVVSKRNFVEDA